MSGTIADLQPHGELRQIFEDVYWVTGAVRMSATIPLSFSRNMIVVRHQGVLTLINSVRLDESGLAALDRLGAVKYVMRLAGFHGMDDPFYKNHYDAEVWTVRGQTYVKGVKVAPSAETYFSADVEMDAGTSLPIPGATLFRFDTARPPEGLILLDRDGGILVSGDCLQNWQRADRYFSLPARLIMSWMGFIKPYNVGPGWLRYAKPDKGEVRGILDLSFDHVLPAHGEPVIGDAKRHYRQTIEALSD